MAGEQKEYVVRVPSITTNKQFHVMRFMDALNVDVSRFKNCKMEREVLFKETKEFQEEQLPEFGAGSEYGRKEKEEARRKKFEKRKNKQNNSPWILKVGKHGKKYKGIREGGVTENSSYYVFFQASDGMFEAFPVNEWYNFTPFQRYKTLSAEEAEAKFIKRDQILNFFQLRKSKNEGDKDESTKKTSSKVKKEFKVSDMDDWDMMENDEYSAEDSDEDSKPRKIKKEKGNKKIKKEDDSGDDEPLEDSDEGDYDDKEVDYMSDLSSSESEEEEEKVNIKGVEDESALRDLVVSDEDEEEENKNEDQEQNEDQSKLDSDKNKSAKAVKKSGNESLSDSDFDSENSDIEDPKSALLFQKSQLLSNKNAKSIKSESSESKSSNDPSSSVKKSKCSSDSSSSANNPSSSQQDNNSPNKSNGLKLKHKLDTPPDEHITKKHKARHDNDITEDAVRKYLIRKPMTAADLVQKFKNKTSKINDLPDLLAKILRKIDPEKQNIKGKMYLSLKP